MCVVTLQVGTEEEPYEGEATILLHGHVRSKELPIYGTKCIAVRQGALELHGINAWRHIHTHILTPVQFAMMRFFSRCTLNAHVHVL